MAAGKLYVIATPLGNLGDITLRALESLKSLDVFFAEDSRELGKLFDAYQIPRSTKRIHSYSNHNMKEATHKALSILEQGSDIGFVSDRGTPAISDPGALLAEQARSRGIPVIPVPGPSAVTALLSASGFPADRFIFLGFLPLKSKEREAVWKRVTECEWPFSFLESPKRIRETLGELAQHFPSAEVCIGREMTKMYETYSRFALSDLASQDVPERGEYTVAVHPHSEKQKEGARDSQAWGEDVRLRSLSDKAWAKELASQYGVPASEIYNALQYKKPRGE